MMFTNETNPNNYADGNALSAVENTVDELITTLEKGGEEAVDWLQKNNMFPNPTKFKGIVSKKDRSDTSNLSLKIDNQVIKTSSDVDTLGIKVDNRLSFKQHISKLCKEAGAKLNAIKRLKSNLNENDRKLLIDAHIVSYFNYCSTVWHFCGRVEIHKMEKLHERSIRFLYNEYNMEYFQLLINKN